MGKRHLLPGTTFSNPQERDEYDSERHSAESAARASRGNARSPSEENFRCEFAPVGCSLGAIGDGAGDWTLVLGQGSASAFFASGQVGAGGGRAGAARIAASRASDEP
jgi:hypothetical protein